MLSALLGIFRALPEIIGVFKEIVAIIQEYAERQRQKEFARDVREALNEARSSHDTSKLESIFRRGNQL